MASVISEELAEAMGVATSVGNHDLGTVYLPKVIEKSFAQMWRTLYLPLANFYVENPNCNLDGVTVAGRRLAEHNPLFAEAINLFSNLPIYSRIVLATRLLTPSLCQVLLEGLVGRVCHEGHRSNFQGNANYRIICGLYSDVIIEDTQVRMYVDNVEASRFPRAVINGKNCFVFDEEVFLSCRVITYPTVKTVEDLQPDYRYLSPQNVLDQAKQDSEADTFNIDPALLPPLPAPQQTADDETEVMLRADLERLKEEYNQLTGTLAQLTGDIEDLKEQYRDVDAKLSDAKQELASVR